MAHAKTYRPEHVITFIRPKAHLAPNFAPFAVPLQFNKLDLRDYLWHAYNVKVLSVRSFINQQSPKHKFDSHRGQVYRPRSRKMMIVELEKPFVWPDPPKGEELEKFDNYLWKKALDFQEKHRKLQKTRQGGNIPLRTTGQPEPERSDIARKAEALLSGREQWRNDVLLDERWKEIEKETTI